MEEVEEIVESIPFRKFIHPFTIYSFDYSKLNNKWCLSLVKSIKYRELETPRGWKIVVQFASYINQPIPTFFFSRTLSLKSKELYPLNLCPIKVDYDILVFSILKFIISNWGFSICTYNIDLRWNFFNSFLLRWAYKGYRCEWEVTLNYADSPFMNHL